MNKQVFKNSSAPDTTNNAGSTAYSMSNFNTLAQLAVTGTFNNTYYASAQDQTTQILELCKKNTPIDVAKIAVYARQAGCMKDTPVVLLAYLFTLKDKTLFNKAYPIILNNVGQIRNFIKVIRSGIMGRKSLGSAGKKAIATLLNQMPGNTIVKQAIGSDPSFKDVLALAHPKPIDAEHQALYAYHMDKEYLKDDLPTILNNYLAFKECDTAIIPDIPFLMLTNLHLNTEQWRQVALKMTWNQLRLNLNNLARKNTFLDVAFTDEIASRLEKEENIKKSRILPFALYSTYASLCENVPQRIRIAVNRALEYSVANAPKLNGKTLILVDTSGSMTSPATGNRGGGTTKLKCVEVAAYFAAALVKANPGYTDVVLFDTKVYPQININPLDSIATITKTFTRFGGGTDCSLGILWAINEHKQYDQIIMISDNESWLNNSWYSTSLSNAWRKYKTFMPKTKLICMDIIPNTTTQVIDRSDCLNVGGFSDTVFSVISDFINKDDNWTSRIRSIAL